MDNSQKGSGPCSDKRYGKPYKGGVGDFSVGTLSALLWSYFWRTDETIQSVYSKIGRAHVWTPVTL